MTNFVWSVTWWHWSLINIIWQVTNGVWHVTNFVWYVTCLHISMIYHHHHLNTTVPYHQHMLTQLWAPPTPQHYHYHLHHQPQYYNHHLHHHYFQTNKNYPKLLKNTSNTSSPLCNDDRRRCCHCLEPSVMVAASLHSAAATSTSPVVVWGKRDCVTKYEY